MGFSVAILAFALEDGPTVLERMDWKVTDQQVGQMVDLDEVSWEEIMSPEFQAANDPHFSSARGDDHFFVYLTLTEIGIPSDEFYAGFSEIAPFLLQSTVETSSVTTVSRWEAGKRLWSVTGITGGGVEIEGVAPIDLKPLVKDARDWLRQQPADEFEPWELKVIRSDDDALYIEEHGFSLIRDWWGTLVDFTYDGDHPPLYRMEGELSLTGQGKDK